MQENDTDVIGDKIEIHYN